jgi:hypothetical protein
VNIPIEIERSRLILAPVAQVRQLFIDVERVVLRFPKLRRLTRLDADSYFWELEPLGAEFGGISHEVKYGVRYALRGEAQADGGELSWEPLPDLGNAAIGGSLRWNAQGEHCLLRFQASGELRELPVPEAYQMFASPFIQGEFIRLVDTFLERTGDVLVQQTQIASTAREKTQEE